MCCGNGSKKAKAQVAPQAPQAPSAPVPGAEGMILIEYIGGNAGKMSFYGPVTHARYVAGGAQRQIYIDKRDAETGSRATPGLLELTDRAAPIFKKVEA